EDMKKRSPRQAEEDLARAKEEIGENAVQRIVDEGFHSLMSEASAEAKLDLAPLIEQMQRQIERTRHR
ncbi:MAG: hypothetical protein MI741_02975, partial [Rhodospirillales bacterium]|nr:hypothetical protein [Rhodospirillales bacterium]